MKKIECDICHGKGVVSLGAFGSTHTMMPMAIGCYKCSGSGLISVNDAIKEKDYSEGYGYGH